LTQKNIAKDITFDPQLNILKESTIDSKMSTANEIVTDPETNMVKKREIKPEICKLIRNFGFGIEIILALLILLALVVNLIMCLPPMATSCKSNSSETNKE